MFNYDELAIAVRIYDHDKVEQLFEQDNPFSDVSTDFDDLESWLCSLFEMSYKNDQKRGQKLIKLFITYLGYEDYFLPTACQFQDVELVEYILNLPNPSTWILYDQNAQYHKEIEMLNYSIKESLKLIKDVEGDYAAEIKRLIYERTNLTVSDIF